MDSALKVVTKPYDKLHNDDSEKKQVRNDFSHALGFDGIARMFKALATSTILIRVS